MGEEEAILSSREKASSLGLKSIDRFKSKHCIAMPLVSLVNWRRDKIDSNRRSSEWPATFSRGIIKGCWVKLPGAPGRLRISGGGYHSGRLGLLQVKDNVIFVLSSRFRGMGLRAFGLA